MSVKVRAPVIELHTSRAEAGGNKEERATLFAKSCGSISLNNFRRVRQNERPNAVKGGEYSHGYQCVYK